LCSTGRTGEINRQRAALYRNGGVAGGQAGGVGADRGARLYRLHGERKARGGKGGDKAATVEAGGGEQAVELLAVVFCIHGLHPSGLLSRVLGSRCRLHREHRGRHACRLVETVIRFKAFRRASDKVTSRYRKSPLWVVHASC